MTLFILSPGGEDRGEGDAADNDSLAANLHEVKSLPEIRRAFLLRKRRDANLLDKREGFTIIIESRLFHIIAHKIMPDHIHMLIEPPPKYPPAMIAQIFKSISSRRMREEFLPIIKKHVCKDGTLWARGYYIASVAQGVTAEVVKEYINNQKSGKAHFAGAGSEINKE